MKLIEILRKKKYLAGAFDTKIYRANRAAAANNEIYFKGVEVHKREWQIY